MDLNGCIKTLQGYLENNPMIILGSGASIPYGLPSMNVLADFIKTDSIISTDPKFGELCGLLDSDGLENSIDRVALSTDTLERIRKLTWEVVNEADLKYFSANPMSPPESFVKLLGKIIAPTPNRAVVVTTNYDRLAEYAADAIKATVVTGFEGSLVRNLEIPSQSTHIKRTRTRERVVDVWKVHGSLDWFMSPSGVPISFPLSKAIASGFQPLIVPPGKNKYSSTHDEPYRSIIAEADKAFTQAGAYICIGYGFNDEHIQPKLLAQISKGKPIVILAKSMTESCKKHIIDANISKYLIFEQLNDTSTKVYGNGWCEQYDGSYWSLDEFIKIW